jgi:short-subunit dehydrogenase
MNTPFQDKYGPWALITGASAGIGKEIARELASRGLNIILVARRQAVLDQVADSFAAHYGVDTRTVAVDFAAPDAANELAAAIADLDVGLVVPNAGIEISGDFIANDLEQHNRMNRINITAPTELAHIFGRRLAARGRGGLLLVSSLVAYQGTPTLASYAAGKAYILSLGEALHVELGRHGVDVSVLSPGVTSTDMVSNMPMNWQKMPLIAQAPETVAKIGVDALGRKSSVVSGLLNKIYAFENRFLPRIWPTKLFGALMRRAMTAAAPRWETSPAGRMGPATRDARPPLRAISGT